MPPSLEVADIFRIAGPAYPAAHAGHLSLHQLKVMSAIEHCRTAALGGHVEVCEDCGHWRIAYNSCRNRHCPKCQGAAARTWLAEREADLLPVGYFHVVFTLPAEVADIAYQNKAVVYDLLFRAASKTMLTIAADPRKERSVTRHGLAPPRLAPSALWAPPQLAPSPSIAALSGFSAGRPHRKSGWIPAKLSPFASAPASASAGRADPQTSRKSKSP